MIHLNALEPLYSLINLDDDTGLAQFVPHTATDNLWLGVCQATEKNAPWIVDTLLSELKSRDVGAKGAWSLALKIAATHGSLQCLEQLLNFHTPTDSNSAMWGAASGGHLACMRLLLPYFDAVSDRNKSLAAAVRHGNPDGVRLLLQVCDPSLDGWRIVETAIAVQNVACIQALVPDTHPQAQDPNDILMKALTDKNILEACLKIFDAKNKPEALAQAFDQNKQSCVELLFPISNVPEAIEILKTRGSNKTEELEARWQQHILLTHVSSNVVRQRKM